MNVKTLLTAGGMISSALCTSAETAQKPNILWIYVEDQSPLFSCYGVDYNQTPTIDKLAKDGVIFKRAFMPSPVCSPTRSSLITGRMNTTIGAHNHRSARSSAHEIHLPEGTKTIPEMFKDAGYLTFNYGKDDYNFTYNRTDLFDGKFKPNMKQGHKGAKIDWTACKPGQPFFGQIQLWGGKNKGKITSMDPAKAELPPYYVDVPEIRKEWAHHYDTARITDREVKEIIDKMRKDGVLQNTIVFFFSDHGYNYGLRHKQFCYDGGLHVPFTVTWYGNPKAITTLGKVRNDLVNGLDISASSLALAGLKVPDYLESKNLFDKAYKRDFVIGTRDRCDFTIDRIRTVRTDKFRYIKNFMTDRPLMQPQYRDKQPNIKLQRKLFEEGKMNKVQAELYNPVRIPEELYDIENDPHQINNLVNDPEYKAQLEKHRQILDKWIKETDDKGQYPEPKAELALMKKWWGKQCVNPEYDGIESSSGANESKKGKKKKKKGKK